MTRLRLAIAAACAVLLVACPNNDDLSCSKHPNERSLPGDRCQHTAGAGFVNHPGPCAIGC